MFAYFNTIENRKNNINGTWNFTTFKHYFINFSPRLKPLIFLTIN